MGIFSVLLLPEMMEHATVCLAHRCKTAVDACGVHSLAQTAVDLADLQAWGDAPDVTESDVGELASPLSGDTNSTANRHDVVAKPLPAFVASSGTLVAAVNGVSAIYLSDDVSENESLKGKHVLVYIAN